jgi:hypothetical protein
MSRELGWSYNDYLEMELQEFISNYQLLIESLEAEKREMDKQAREARMRR